MMSKKIFFTFIFAAISLAACGAAASYESEMPVGAPALADYDTVGMETANTGFSQGVTPTTERMVVKDGQIGLAVDDPSVSAGRIQEMAEAMGGYVVALQMYQTTLENGLQVPQGYITVRVPSERLNEAIEKIKAETDQPVLSENINSQDVTAEYTDLSSRLRNLESAEEQLQQIMEEAVKTEDVLNVYDQLVSTREQIELIKGQMQYYEQAAALSSIKVELYTNEAVQPLTVGGWEPKGVAKDAVQTLINTLKWLANAGIWIVLYVLPTMICIFGPLALIYYFVRRFYKKNKKEKAAPPADGA
jgi:hypothetical protein